MSSTTTTTPSIMSSSLFTPRFVPHRLVWKNDDDVCYECIDRNSYASVIVRLRKFETSNVELYKANIAKAEKEAIKHECIANLTEIIIDDANKISITVSENPRGITFIKYVETYGSAKEFPAALQQILTNISDLFQILNSTGKDFCAIPLQHLIIATNDGKIESMKVRRPFLSALTKRSLLAPYNRYSNCNPSFVDITSIAFYALTQKNFFEFENVEEALNILEPLQRTIIFEILISTNFEEVSNCIQRMKSSDTEIVNQYDCDEISETSSFGICDDDEEEDKQFDEGVSSDSDYDIVNHSKSTKDDDDDEVRTAIGKEDVDEILTAIDKDEFETQTAIEDDETQTAVEDDEDEIRTAIDESDEVETAFEEEYELETAVEMEEDETQTAIEEDETKTAIEDDEDEIRTAIEDDETKTAIEDDDDETQTAIDDESDEVETAFEEEYELETAVEMEEDETKTAIEDDETKTAIEDDEDEIRTAIDDDETKTAIEDDDDETQTAIDDDTDEVETAIGDDENVEADFHVCNAAENEFGLHIPNIDKVFKCHPTFYLTNATLNVEENALVYKRLFSSVTYRKLVIYFENDEISYVTFESCYGSNVHGKCIHSATYKRFSDMSFEANFCLMEVYIAVANALSVQSIYTFKNYGIEGLTIRFMANKKIHCEFDDQFILCTNDGQVLVASDAQDKMPEFELLKNILADLSKMSENFEKTSNKKFTITFTEQQ